MAGRDWFTAAELSSALRPVSNYRNQILAPSQHTDIASVEFLNIVSMSTGTVLIAAFSNRVIRQFGSA